MIVEISERMSSEVNFGATVTTPTGFDPEKESLPMIVFLHGAGERGEDLSIVNKVGLPKYFTADPDYKGLRVITLSPQCPDYTVWNDVSLQLFQFILKAAKAYNADMDRISVTGLSMGGFGTWDMLMRHGSRFAAGIPRCGGADGIGAAPAKPTQRTAAIVARQTSNGTSDTFLMLQFYEQTLNFSFFCAKIGKSGFRFYKYSRFTIELSQIIV